MAREAGSPLEHSKFCGKMEAPPGFEPGMEVLQTVQGWFS